jgi:GNAT superfamily N-acetyltransferase
MTNDLVVPPGFKLITPADRADYRDLVGDIADVAWPEFMLHDPIANEHWHELYDRFAPFQFGLLEIATDTAVAMGNSIPLAWTGELSDLPEEGWDWAFVQGVADHAAGRPPRLQCALQIALRPEVQGRGLSRLMVQTMKAIGGSQGVRTLIAPVRPSAKHRYPLVSIDRYVEWKMAEGLPFDPWLRVHARLGARISKPCRRAMTIPGEIAQWESWTGLRFPESGVYIVPGALTPVEMDVEANLGIYVEPNVWMVHAPGD